MTDQNLKKVLTISLGSFWVLDGILQLQPAMFTNVFVSTVLAPNLQSQPAMIAGIVAFGIHLWNLDPFWFNLGSALIQLLIGVLLIFPFRSALQRFALWLSVAWALIIWIFGEGFGNLFTGTATLYTGAPGSALLYLILALFLLYSFYKKLPLIAGIIFLVGALLNLAPMFWQGNVIENLFACGALAILGLLLIFLPNRPIAWAAIVFLIGVWCVGQGFGGFQTFPGGTATDPNSAPLFILFLLPIVLLPRPTSPVSA